MQFTAVLSDHVDPSFLLSSPLSGSIYISVVCYFGVSFVLHPIQMSNRMKNERYPKIAIVEYVYTIHGRDLTQDEQVAYLHPTWNNESFTVPRRLHPPWRILHFLPIP